MRGLAVVAFLSWQAGVSAMGDAVLNTRNAVKQLTSASSTIITTVAGRTFYASGNSSNADGIVATARVLSNPLGLATDLLGNFYISDSNHHKILKVAVSSKHWFDHHCSRNWIWKLQWGWR